MSRYKILGIAFASFLVIGFIFQNCSQQVAVDSVATLSESCPRSKMGFQKSSVSKSYLENDSSDGSPLTLVIDPFCLQASEEPVDFFGQSIDWPAESRNDQRVAIRLQGPPEVDGHQVDEWLQSQPCVVGLFDDLDVSQGALDSDLDAFDDPEVINQRHLSFVEFYDSIEFQNQLTEPVVVAVIDTGVDYTHTDLQTSMWRGPTGEYGHNFVDNNDDPMDEDGHGTHIAGLISAKQNNSFGVIGAANDKIKIMAVKSLPFKGSGKSSAIYNGIQYAIQQGADVISLSIYSEGYNTMLETAIIDAVKAGVVVVVAIGNQSLELTAENVVAPAYIGSVLNGVISVASLDTTTGAVSFFSNFGTSFAEIGAPGAEIGGRADGGLLSTLPGQSWGRMRGTSQAAPLVAAMAAITISHLRTQKISYTPAGIEKIIKNYGSHQASLIENQVNQGRMMSFRKMAENLSNPEVLTEIGSGRFDEGLCSQ